MAFTRSLAPTLVENRQENFCAAKQEQSIREEILYGLMADKGGSAQISTAMRVLGRDHRQRCVTVGAIDGVIQNNQKPGKIPRRWLTGRYKQPDG